MRFLSLFCVIGLSACGISDSTLLADLDGDDAVSICEDEAYTKAVDCEGTEITLESDCTAATLSVPEGCTATVGDYRSCAQAIAVMSDDDVCAFNFPSECSALFADSCVTTE